MVGGLADWFAVTALFRHPLGLPIPHTAIIPTRKDALGRSLGSFVQDNFLAGPIIAEKLRAARVSARLAGWISQPGSAATVARHASAALAGGVEVLDDADVQDGLEHALASAVRRVPAAPLAGRALEIATAEGRHHELVDATGPGDAALPRRAPARRCAAASAGSRPGGCPRPSTAGSSTSSTPGLRGFVAEVGATRDHEFRRYLDERLDELAQRLQTDPELAAKGEKWKEELLEHPAVRSWTGLAVGRSQGGAGRPGRRPRLRAAPPAGGRGHHPGSGTGGTTRRCRTRSTAGWSRPRCTWSNRSGTRWPS